MTVDVYEPSNDRHRWVGLLPAVADLAHRVADTNFVPQAMRGDEAAIVAAVLYGDEIGLSPMASLASIAVINGRPTVSAEAQRGLILAAGHSIWPEDASVTKSTWAGQRMDDGHVARVTWTLDDAKRAGLAGKQNWRMYPRQMLSARASAELARAVFSDVIHGLAASEEIEDAVPLGFESGVEEEPPKTTRRRRDRTGPPPVIAAMPAPPPERRDEPPLPGEGPDEPPKEPTEAQLKKLFALLGEHGIRDRQARLAWANEHLERTITTSADLTDAEVHTLIGELEKMSQASGAIEPLASEKAGAAAPPPAAAPAELFPEDEIRLADHVVETLWWMKGEANLIDETGRDVTDDWVRSFLESQGADVGTGRITKATLRQLNPVQAAALRDALGAIIDQRNAE